MRTIDIVSGVLAFGLLGVVPAFGQGDEHAHHMMAMTTPPAGSPARVMEVQPRPGDLAFLDQSGRRVSLRDVLDADEPVFVNFIFTSCTTICPVMSAGFADLRKRLAADGARVRLVSISIDPEVDTPARLKAYAARLGAGEDWMFLTGTLADVETAQRAFGAFRGAKESHTASTFIRRGKKARWEQLEGLAGGETLLRAYRGAEDPAPLSRRD